MARLLNGRTTVTDGRLTKNNLHREAGVSRATMNRATDILDEWNAAVDSPQPRDAEITKRDDAIKDLRTTVARLRADVQELQNQVVAATTVIASLHQENQALKGTEISENVSAFKSRDQTRHSRR